MTKSLLNIFLLFFAFSSVFADTFYVSPAGNNGNAGDQNNPWATIQHGVGQIAAGDVLIVRAGTYSGRVIINASGTSGNRITLRTEGAVILEGGFEVIGSYITLDGFEITNNGGDNGINSGGSADYVQILNFNFHDLGNMNTRFIEFPRSDTFSTSPAGWEIRGNWFHGDVPAQMYILTGGNGHIIEDNEFGPGVVNEDCFRPFGDNHIIRNNYIHDVTSGGGHTDIMQTFGYVRNLLFERNTILGWDGQAWMLRGTDESELIVIRNNLFVDVESAGQSYIPHTDVHNNTFVGCGYGNGRAVMMRGGESVNAENAEIKNNIFYNCGNTPNNGWYVADAGPANTLQADHNLVYPNKANFSETNGINGSDPLFANEAMNDFHLTENSPAVDAGVSLADFSDDNEGFLRGHGSGWDMGAFEFGSVSEEPELLPEVFFLFQNFPNPFNPGTQIDYYVPFTSDVEISVHNVLGQRVRTLFNGRKDEGRHNAIWNGENESGLLMPSGIYFSRLKSGTNVQTRKMVLIK